MNALEALQNVAARGIDPLTGKPFPKTAAQLYEGDWLEAGLPPEVHGPFDTKEDAEKAQRE